MLHYKNINNNSQLLCTTCYPHGVSAATDLHMEQKQMFKGKRENDERIGKDIHMATSKNTKKGSLLYDDTPLPFTNHNCIVKPSILVCGKSVRSRLRTNMIELWLEIGQSFFVVKHSLFSLSLYVVLQ